MTFEGLEAGLRERVRERVRRGEISERRLARQAGYTQPHIHNVLKGARRLNADLADRLLAAMHLRVEDLLEAEASRTAEARICRGAVGPRQGFPDLAESREKRELPSGLAARYWEPVLVRAAEDADSMVPLILPGDLLLLDRAPEARRRPTLDAIWAVAFQGRGALCRCKIVGSALVLVADNTRGRDRLPEQLRVTRGEILEVVQGRVVWVGRELDLV